MTPIDLSPLEQRLHAMPPVQALGLRLQHFDGDQMVLTAPLAANINDKGNAFGGSLASTMTLAAWALMSARLEQAGHRADVYVQDSSIRYLAPLYDDLVAKAELAPEHSWEEITDTFSQRGKARARMTAHILDAAGTLCCTLEGRFVALMPKGAP